MGFGYTYSVLSFAFFLFFFFVGTRLRRQTAIVHALFMNSSRTIWLFLPFSAHQWVLWIVQENHKSHFSITFSLKMGLIVLFTYLKIVLLQYFQFSVFSFSKINFIQTDLIGISTVLPFINLYFFITLSFWDWHYLPFQKLILCFFFFFLKFLNWNTRPCFFNWIVNSNWELS